MCHYYADSLYTKIFLQREDPCNKYVIFIEIDTTEMPAHCQLAKSYAFKSTKIRFDFKKPGNFTADFKILLKVYESHHINIKLHALARYRMGVAARPASKPIHSQLNVPPDHGLQLLGVVLLNTVNVFGPQAT